MNALTAALKRISSAINYVFIALSLVFLSVTTVSCFIQVIARYVFNNSLSWTEELARYSFIWLTLSGTTIATKNAAHAKIDVIVSLFKGKVRTIQHVFVDIMILGVCALFFVQSIPLLEVTSKQLSVAMRIPMNYVYLSVPVCSAAMFIHTLTNLFAFLHPEKPQAETVEESVMEGDTL